ncbi:MAG: hypothetical protein ACF8XB_22940 [Planctomycetota bacterium JB042]
MGLRAAVVSLALLAFAPSADAQNRRILWDTHHGVYSPYTLASRFNTLVSELQTIGIDVVESSAGVLNQDLSSFDVVVVSALNASSTAYTVAEAQAILSFASSGGGVLIVGDNPVVWPSHTAEVAKVFDFQLSTADLTPSDVYATVLSPAEPMFQGINSVYGKAGGEIVVGPSSSIVGATSAGQGMIARWNGGSVVAHGDANIFDDVYIANGDNVAYVKTLFDWLAEGCVTPLGPGTTGTGGVVPRLSLGSGSCQGVFSLKMEDALGGASALLFVGTQSAGIPAVGGTLYVDAFTPPFLSILLPLGGTPGASGGGSLLLVQDLTAYVPLTLVFQYAVIDSGAAFGYALSNGVQIDMAP